MGENKYLKKFIPEDYISGNSLIADYEGNISIVGNRITFAHLEFDAAVKINTTGLVLSKDINDVLDNEICHFKGRNYDDSTLFVSRDSGEVSNMKKFISMNTQTSKSCTKLL